MAGVAKMMIFELTVASDCVGTQSLVSYALTSDLQLFSHTVFTLSDLNRSPNRKTKLWFYIYLNESSLEYELL